MPVLALSTYLFLLYPPEAHPVPELLLLMIGAVYLPALWASVAPTPIRRTVLLATSLLMLVLSVPFLSRFFGPTILVFIVPPALLLLVGAAKCKERQS
jgi:hypothetical protein